MPTYPIYKLTFMKIKNDVRDVYYLGEYSAEYNRVFIPTLNKSFAKDEVVFGHPLSDEYVMSVKATAKRVRYEEDDDGLPYCHSRKELNLADIRNLESAKNTPKAPSKKDSRFFR